MKQVKQALGIHRVILVVFGPLFLSACNLETETGPGKVRWDREACTRCIMTISDPNFSAQIRGGPAGKKQELIKFDDLGCAVIWLDQQNWKDDPLVEIWVNQHQTGEWIDARQARYVKNQLTPMNYGLGAQLEAAPGAMSFNEAREHIYKIEDELNLHGGATHLTPPLSTDSNHSQ
jgi:hypothetical protein